MRTKTIKKLDRKHRKRRPSLKPPVEDYDRLAEIQLAKDTAIKEAKRKRLKEADDAEEESQEGPPEEVAVVEKAPVDDKKPRSVRRGTRPKGS